MASTREDWLRTEMWTGRDQRGDFSSFLFRSNAVACELLGQQEGRAGVLGQQGYFTLVRSIGPFWMPIFSSFFFSKNIRFSENNRFDHIIF
jgi:hypothetical protein